MKLAFDGLNFAALAAICGGVYRLFGVDVALISGGCLVLWLNFYMLFITSRSGK